MLLAIALIHLFRVGSYLRGPLYTLYYSYFSDVVVPFGMYFLLGLSDRGVRRRADRRLKALQVFAAASSIEVMQAFGVPLLGRTFDPLDFVMFAAGVLLAAFVDVVLLERLTGRRTPETARRADAV